MKHRQYDTNDILSARYRRVTGKDPTPSDLRAAKRGWESALNFMNVLLRRTDERRVPVVCRDGHTVTLITRDGATEVCTVIVDAEDEWTAEWDVPHPARGMYRDVHVANIVEWVWIHGGVDMPASREAVK